MFDIAVVLPSKLLKSLRRLSGGQAGRRVRVDHVARLIDLGFASMHAGVPVVTTRGHAKLALEITRASWRSVPA